MLKRLFEPMECDRACQWRQYTLWASPFVLFFFGGWALKLSQRWGWINVNDDQLTCLIFGGLLVIYPLIVILWCRTHAAY
jgi:hypothetical protein